MAFARPTFDELFTRTKGDLRAQLQAAGKRATLLRRTKTWVWAYVVASMWHVMYGVLDWISLQILPSTATDFDYVKAHGETYGTPQLLATKATGTVTLTGDNGSVIDTDTELVREDGAVYRVTGHSVTISGGTGTASLEAEVAGVVGNMDVGTTLTLSSPISGVDSEATVASGFDDGTDDEEMEPLRDRILEAISEPGHGGDANDYRVWARESSSNVSRVLVVPLGHGPGTVDVYFLVNSGGTGIGIPTVDQVADVQEYLDSKRPVTAKVYVMAPTEVEVDITVDDLTPNTTPKKVLVEAQIDALFLSKALTEATVYPNELYTAIDGASGVVSFDLDDPTAVVTADIGEVLVLAAGTPGSRVTFT